MLFLVIRTLVPSGLFMYATRVCSGIEGMKLQGRSSIRLLGRFGMSTRRSESWYALRLEGEGELGAIEREEKMLKQQWQWCFHDREAPRNGEDRVYGGRIRVCASTTTLFPLYVSRQVVIACLDPKLGIVEAASLISVERGVVRERSL